MNGTLTSSTGNIDVIFNKETPESLLSIHTKITDYGYIRVGITFKRNALGYDHRGANLGGGESNTFTGDVTVLGYTMLNLEKLPGAIAVPKNLNIVDGAHVRILRDEQISDTSRVSLISKGKEPSSGLYFIYISYVGKSELKETIRELFVDGRGHVDFYRYKDIELKTHRSFLFLDDLIITDGSLLTIDSWTEGMDHLLVRKDSVHLEESLKKIKFTGYKTVHKRDYDENYWEIYAQLPEPSTYGAGLLLIGVGTVVLRKRHRPQSRLSQQPTPDPASPFREKVSSLPLHGQPVNPPTRFRHRNESF